MSAFACRSCGETNVEPVLSLGEIPLVNALVEPGAPEPDRRYPLDVVRCPACTLVQITETVPPETLFRSYTYFSSYSQTFLDHARRFADESIRRRSLGPQSLVVEAASNDGYLLQYFAGAKVRTLGVEPAQNVAAVARERGIDTIAEFLDEALAGKIVAEHGHADLVVANNVLAHVPDPHGFVGALGTLAGERGEVVVEVPYLRELVERLEFDTIYHEHLSYFTLTSLAGLLEPLELAIVDVEHLPVHGGSLRIVASRSRMPSPSVPRLLAEEQAWGVENGAPLVAFAAGVRSLQRELHELVAGLVESGSSVAAYGAAAKGVVLANVCGLDSDLVDFVVDRNPHKQGKLLPGVRIPVRPPNELEQQRPDYCLLFAWNLTDEILAQQTAYREKGGRFIAPLPAPQVLA